MNEAPTQMNSGEVDSSDRALQTLLQTLLQVNSVQQLAGSAETRSSQRFSFFPIAQKNFCIRRNQAGEMSYIMSLNLPDIQDFWPELAEELS